METALHDLVSSQGMPILVAIMAVSIIVLGKGADVLVDEAVAVSLRFGMPRMVVGATLVSLGTTAPEAVVSVFAALTGDSSIALGNAVGSIICDTGLILGLACLLMPLPVDKNLVNRQGRIQFLSGCLLVAVCIPWSDPIKGFKEGSTMHQLVGFFFCFLLIVYLYWSVKIASGAKDDSDDTGEEVEGRAAWSIALRMLLAVAGVVVASAFLIASAKETAERLSVPNAIISATVVAFGTSLPELVTALTAVRKRQGELAVGNVIGADILNALFVAGAAAAVTPEGLFVDPSFFMLQFPAMLFVLTVFRLGVWWSKSDDQGTKTLTRVFGVALLSAYLAVTTLSFIVTRNS